MNFKSMQSKLAMNPKHLFLIDGIGALVSAFLLGVVLVRYSDVIGLEDKTLLLVASFPCIFALYDFLCLFFVNKSYSSYIMIIAGSNLLYCFLSIGIAFYHVDTLTILGWTYIIIEVVIVMILSLIEYKVASSI